jgi:DNA-binding transcriptional MerR regulator
MESLLISQVAQSAGVCPETIRRLERRGAIPPATRDVNGWRRYPPEAVQRIRKLYMVEGESLEPKEDA